jgi:hypothetical protein
VRGNADAQFGHFGAGILAVFANASERRIAAADHVRVIGNRDRDIRVRRVAQALERRARKAVHTDQAARIVRCRSVHGFGTRTRNSRQFADLEPATNPVAGQLADTVARECDGCGQLVAQRSPLRKLCNCNQRLCNRIAVNRISAF